MEAPQQFRLRWNNHKETLVKVLTTLLNSEQYVDCTLAAEGQQINAHKVVLSACSPYLHNILQTHDNKHPVLILKDVRFTDLEAMVRYMYNGEVNVAQENLNTFLKAAESLKLAGLTGATTNTESTDQLKKKSKPKVNLKSPKVEFINKPSENASLREKRPIVNGSQTSAPFQQLDNFSMNTASERGGKRLKTEQSSDEEEDVNLDDGNHGIDGYVCIRCDRSFQTRHDLLNHSVHQCTTVFKPFICSLCRQSFSYKRLLQTHLMKYCDQMLRYKCSYCDEKTANTAQLMDHVNTYHSKQITDNEMAMWRN